MRLPSLAVARAAFTLEADTGVLHWNYRSDRLANWNARLAGTVAGSKNSAGYIHVRFNGKFYPAHRLVWLLFYGAPPLGEIDHVDGDRVNNRPNNLRDVTRRQNRMNMAARGEWPKGVYRCKRDGSFRAQIKIHGRGNYLGVFSTPEAAHAAYKSAADRMFGEYACYDR